MRQRLFWGIFFVLVWELVSYSGLFSPLIFPSIREIMKILYQSILNGELLLQTLFSLTLILEGIIISLLIALLFSFLAYSFKPLKGLLDTLITLFHPLPGIALMPLVLIWIGAGRGAILFIIIHSILWPMVLNLLTGFRAIPELYKMVGQNYGLSPGEIVWSILTPASFPYLLTGVKIGWARAWRALISAEMLFGAAGGSGGLGWYIFKERVFFNLPGVFAGLIVIVLIGLLVEELFIKKLEENTTIKWGMQT